MNKDETLLYEGKNAVKEYKKYCKSSGYNIDNLIGIPIENDGGTGTAGGHPEEGSLTNVSKNDRSFNDSLHPGLNNEMMTGWENNSSDPLSRITIGFLDDLGYDVDYNKADYYKIS